MLVEGNPVSNFKLLYGTGHMKLNREKGVIERVGGVSYTVKDGVVYDAKALLQDVRDMVTTARESEARKGSSIEGLFCRLEDRCHLTSL